MVLLRREVYLLPVLWSGFVLEKSDEYLFLGS